MIKIKDYLKKEKSAMKWLFPAETAMVIYAIFTLALVLFTSTKLGNADALLWERIRVVMTTVALWVVYRQWPCRQMAFARIAILLVFLGWWYPDTYELNKHFDNLDHVFAGMDQALFGCQPALLWSQNFTSVIVKEAMNFGYSMYYPMFVLFIVYIFATRYDQLQRVAFVILGAFYVYYVIFDLLPVTGPQYYYLAAGVENIAAGTFPDVGTYFSQMRDCMPNPGYEDGLFYHLVTMAHETGERPTAAFPSSHVGIATVTLALAMKMKEWKFSLIIAVPYLLMCFATVYIRAHYAVDAIAGFITAVPLMFALDLVYVKFYGKSLVKSRK